MSRLAPHHGRSFPPHQHIERIFAIQPWNHQLDSVSSWWVSSSANDESTEADDDKSNLVQIITERFCLSLDDLVEMRKPHEAGHPVFTEAEVFHFARAMIDAIHHLGRNGFAHRHIAV